MKGIIWVDNPGRDKKLIEPLIERFRALIDRHDLKRCTVEIYDNRIFITPGLELPKQKKQKRNPRYKKKQRVA